MSTTTAFDLIVEEVARSLRDAGLPAFVNRSRPVARDEAAAVKLRLAGAQRLRDMVGVIDWRTDLAVTVSSRVPGALGTTVEPTAHGAGLLLSTWQALRATAIDGLGVIEINPGRALEWQFDAADQQLISVELSVAVDHRTDADLQPVN